MLLGGFIVADMGLRFLMVWYFGGREIVSGARGFDVSADRSSGWCQCTVRVKRRALFGLMSRIRSCTFVGRRRRSDF